MLCSDFLLDKQTKKNEVWHFKKRGKTQNQVGKDFSEISVIVALSCTLCPFPLPQRKPPSQREGGREEAGRERCGGVIELIVNCKRCSATGTDYVCGNRTAGSHPSPTTHTHTAHLCLPGHLAAIDRFHPSPTLCSVIQTRESQ